MAEKSKNNYFDLLSNINVNEHKEDKNGLSYLSWTWAMAEMLKNYPDMTYEVKLFDGKPYIFDEKLGYIVFTSVTVEGVTRDMWLPVMDSKNNAMKDVPYKVETKKGSMDVKAATMFDINKTIMRCVTKNFAVFGLGLYIYSGEDLPEAEAEAKKEEEAKRKEEEAKKKEEAKAKKEKEAKELLKQITPSDVKNIENLAKEAGSAILNIASAYNVSNLAELNYGQYKDLIAKLKYKIDKKNEEKEQ